MPGGPTPAGPVSVCCYMDLSTLDHDHPSFYLNPHEVLTRIHQEQPVLHTSAKGGYWLLTRYADVRAALLDWQNFSSAGLAPSRIHAQWPPEAAIVELPVGSDPPAHTKYRALVAPWFGREHVAPLEPDLRNDARGLLKKLAAAGGGDAVQDFALPYVMTALARFLAVPVSDSERFMEYAEGTFMGRASGRPVADQSRYGLIEYVHDRMSGDRGGESSYFLVPRRQPRQRPEARRRGDPGFRVTRLPGRGGDDRQRHSQQHAPPRHPSRRPGPAAGSPR